jgi:hypothetical protein
LELDSVEAGALACLGLQRSPVSVVE